MGLVRARPSREILSGDSADVYFARAASIMEREGLDPVVTMEVFARREAILCGIDEVKNLLAHVLGTSKPDAAASVEGGRDRGVYPPATWCRTMRRAGARCRPAPRRS